jgi:transcriptional regulator with XRE-family HTH domain
MEKLKRLREERGLSQVKLAARADLNPATVNQIERGMRDASPGTLRKLADALEVSLYELLEEEAPKAQAPRQLKSEVQRGATYTEYEALGRVLASNWKQDLEEWDEKIPAGESPGLFDFGRLVEWAMTIGSVKAAYQAITEESRPTRRKELEDTLRMLEDAQRGAFQLVKRAFEPAKTYAEFRKIWEANDLDAVTSEVEGR